MAERQLRGAQHPRNQIVLSPGRKPICQEIMINLVAHGKKMQYTNPNDPPLLTLAGCHPGWDDYLDLGETVNEMAHRLIAEDAQKGTEAAHGGCHPPTGGCKFYRADTTSRLSDGLSCHFPRRPLLDLHVTME